MSRGARALLLRGFTTPLGFDARDGLLVERRNAVLLEERLGRGELRLARRDLREKGGHVPLVPSRGERLEVLEGRVVEREARGLRLARAHTGSVAHMAA